MKTFKKIIKFIFYLFLIGTFGLITAFYTHPSFMEEHAGKYFSWFQSIDSPYKGDFEKCMEYKAVSSKLDDRYFDYIWNSAYQKFGDVIKNKEEIRPYYLEKKLLLVDSSDLYVVDTLFHSYAFLTKDAKVLLDEIGRNFQAKLKNTSFKNTRFFVSSLLRTEKTVKRLMRRNRNSLRISSHLHGTTFDIAHNEFVSPRLLNACELDYLKETLAQCLSELRKKKRCFVTYETRQACFHIVNRKD